MTQAGSLPRAFRGLLVAESASSVGTSVTLVALQTVVVETLGGGTPETGLLSAARWLPTLVIGLLVGALVDRLRRRPLMVWSDLARAAVLAIVPALWALDALTLGSLLAVVLLYGVAAVVNDAASMAFLPRLVPTGALQAAHARIDTADAVAQSAGPAVGGAIIRVVGAPLALLVDVATSLVAAACVATIRLDEPAPARGGRRIRDVARDIGEGVRLVYRGTALTRLAIGTHVWFAANAVLGVLVAPLALDLLGIGAVAFGIVLACAGVGAVVGALVTGRIGRRLGPLATIGACHVASALAVLGMLAALAMPTALGAAMLGFGQLLHGLTMGASNSHEMAYRQSRTADDAQARVNMTMRTANRSVIVLVAPVAGLVAAMTGIGPMLVVAAAGFVIAGLAVVGRGRGR